MRKLMTGLAVAAITAATLATPAMARPGDDHRVVVGEAAAGAVVGTAVGVGLYHGWYGSGVTATALGATAGTAAVAGGVAGVGTIALIDALAQPCRGFNAIFGLNKDVCWNGEYVGHAPRRMR
jgi:high-affinity Fe2+/Pb2+ permease